MFDFLKRLFATSNGNGKEGKQEQSETEKNHQQMNFLIVGLGNIGSEYAQTRHNIGFRVLDALAKASNLVFEDKRYGAVTTLKVKNQTLTLLKPSTYMNLSGNAVRYWMNEKKIPLENILVVVDDLSLPFGQLRMRPGGSEAGHIGNDFPRGGQVDFVLGEFTDEDLKTMDERLELAGEMVKSFALSGIQFTMNHFNKK